MMDEEELLQAIRENPDDLQLRLVYADWLEEQGHPQAELIRIQCELEQLPDHGKRRSALKFQEKEWLHKFRKRLIGRLRRIAYTWEIRRGFVERLAVDVVKFLHRTNDICQLAPVAAIELFGQFPRREGDHYARILAQCRHISRVVVLDLAHNNITSRGMRYLASSRYWSRVTSLGLSNNLLSDEGARFLANSGLAKYLQNLELANNLIADEGLQALAQSRRLRRLKHLDLHSNSITSQGMETLASSRLLRRLRTLNLSANALTDRGIEALTNCPQPLRMTGLDLSHNFITDDGLRLLARCAALSRLRGLDLSHNCITARGRSWWAASPYISAALPRHLFPD